MLKHTTLSILVALSASIALADAPACKFPEQATKIPDPVPKGRIALTFDDGPNPDTTPHVLDILKKYNIKATFFLIGSNIDGPEAIALVKRELREGHNIGNHTWTHPHMGQVSEAQVRTEIDKTDKILSQFKKNRPRVMRFPYGESSCYAEEYVESKHYNIVGWDLDSCDWSYGEGIQKSDCVSPELQKKYADGYQGWIDEQLKTTPGGVILMHDAEEYEAKHLEQEILHLKAEGYAFVELDKGLFPNLVADHTGWNPAAASPTPAPSPAPGAAPATPVAPPPAPAEY